MASLNLAGKTSGYVKLTAPDDSSTNPTVTLPTESGELALKSKGVWSEEGGLDTNKVAFYDGSLGVGTKTPFAPSGKTIEIEDDATTRLILNNKSASRMALLTPNEGGLHFNDYTDLDNVKTPLKIASDGSILMSDSSGVAAMEVTTTKKAKFYGEVQITSLPTNGNPSNVYVNDSGVLYKSTATTYSAEEVDKKLAIKDKLIEKLSARLDKLEKRLKK